MPRNLHPITILVSGPSRANRRSIADFVIETQPAVGPKFSRARCRNTALPRPAMRGARVVIDLDNEIIEVIVAPQPVAAAIAIQPHRLVVMAVVRILAPGVFGADGANRQEGARSRVAVGAPPQLPRPEGAPWGAAIALALVGPDAAAPQRDRDGAPARGQPAPARIAGGGANPDRWKAADRADLFYKYLK